MDNVIEQIKEIAVKYNIEKITLFGSRARGDHSLVSDYDIAVFTNSLSQVDKALFKTDIEEVNTLKKIDVVFISDSSNDELLENINKEGVVIWLNSKTS